MLKNKITLFSVLVVVASMSIAALFIAFKGEAQTQQNNNKKEIKIRQIQREKDSLMEATPIQEGVMTAKQKKHSKIFKGYKDRAKLHDLIAGKGDVEVIQRVGNIRTPMSFNLKTYLQELSCKADAIIVGTVKSNASQFNEDGTFIFTDYEFTPEEVLKNNATTSINLNTNITVTRTGGAVKLKGHTARAIDYRQMPLIVGEQYLLFVKYIPETGAYQSLDDSRDDDSFQIMENQMIRQVSRNPLPFGASYAVDKNDFMAEVRTTANGTCVNQGGAK